MSHPIPSELFKRPASEQEVLTIVAQARKNNQKIRVAGSAHSVTESIFTDGYDPRAAAPLQQPGSIDLLLDQLNHIEFSKATDPDGNQIDVVKVGGGAWLGPDPGHAHVGGESESESESERPNLIRELRGNGMALDVVGGITHQSVGGFMNTGSAGASVKYSYGDAVMAFKIVDGTGRVQTLSRSPSSASQTEKDKNPFYAAGVSMGLYGIITEVTLKIVPMYFVVGTSKIQEVERCELDLFGSSENSLRNFFEKEDYSRLLLWPQKGVNKVQIWRCSRTSRAEDEPHRQFQHPALEQPAISALYLGVLPNIAKGEWSKALGALDELGAAVQQAMSAPGAAPVAAGGSSLDELVGELAQFRASVEQLQQATAAGQRIDPLEVYGRTLMTIINLFQKEGEVSFQDSWYHGVPDDNQVNERMLPVRFTELWVPLSRSAEAMTALKQLYETLDAWHKGSFCVEIYAARKSDFWISPAYGNEGVLRIDVFIMEGGPEWDRQEDFYKPFWDLLAQYDARFHWGKALSRPDDEATGVAYRQKTIPKLQEFLDLRGTFDPDQLFLSDYWRRHLGIESAAQAST
jgi:hypothetical protein